MRGWSRFIDLLQLRFVELYPLCQWNSDTLTSSNNNLYLYSYKYSSCLNGNVHIHTHTHCLFSTPGTSYPYSYCYNSLIHNSRFFTKKSFNSVWIWVYYIELFMAWYLAKWTTYIFTIYIYLQIYISILVA